MTRRQAVLLSLLALPIGTVLLMWLVLIAAFGPVRRAHIALLGLDLALSGMTGGEEGETISARAGLGQRMAEVGGALPLNVRFWRWMAPKIDWFFGSGHCDREYLQYERESR